MSSVWDAVEDADRVAVVEETDDSCTAHPTHTLTDSHCSTDFTGPVIEVEPENSSNTKTEDADENDMESKDFSEKVRVTCCSYFDAYILCINYTSSLGTY